MVQLLVAGTDFSTTTNVLNSSKEVKQLKLQHHYEATGTDIGTLLYDLDWNLITARFQVRFHIFNSDESSV
jgi:hypothetical protein